MNHKALTELAKVAIEREREKQAMEKLESENKQKQEEMLLALRGKQLKELLPSDTWVELGLDLDFLQTRDTTRTAYVCVGEVSFEFDGATYEGPTRLVAKYGADLVESRPVRVTLHIGDQKAAFSIRGGEQTHAFYHIQQINQGHLSDLLMSFISDEHIKLQKKQERRIRNTYNCLESSQMTIARCEAFITKMETADNLKIPKESIDELIEKAEERLSQLKFDEADEANDKALLEQINQKALNYETNIGFYQRSAEMWANLATIKHWEPFNTYVVTYSVGSSQTRQARCLTDEPDGRGYYDVIGEDGVVTKKRFPSIVMWKCEEHTELPSESEAVAGCSHIWCDEVVVNLPPTTDKELLAEIAATKPEEPESWRSEVGPYVADFADQVLASQLEQLLSEWFDDATAIGKFRRDYLNWFDD